MKTMKILMLKGKGNCGKTTTIKKVLDVLLKESQMIEKEAAYEPDCLCVLLYKGLKIGIFSMGDYAREIVAKIDEYAEKGCDVFLCACNDRFVTPLRKMETYECSMLIHKTLCDTSISMEEANDRDANKIINQIYLLSV